MPGPPLFATDEPGTGDEPWGMWYLAAAMAVTWTEDPLGYGTGKPTDIGVEELREKTEGAYWEARKGESLFKKGKVVG